MIKTKEWLITAQAYGKCDDSKQTMILHDSFHEHSKDIAIQKFNTKYGYSFNILKIFSCEEQNAI